MITEHCPNCGKLAIETNRLGSFIKLSCGHLLAQEKLSRPILDGHSLDQAAREPWQKVRYNVSADLKKTLYNYQEKDLDTIENANCRVLLTYECGLGKTITSLFTLKNFPSLYPALIICKSALQVQWMKESLGILGESVTPILLTNGKQHPLCRIDSVTGLQVPFPIHIISFDMLRRMGDKLDQFGFKTIIIDECQHIKDLKVERTKQVQRLCEQAKHVLALSATPIKNNAGEYFPILNILQPTMFPIQDAFIRNHCALYLSNSGFKKVAGLRNPEHFKELTKHFIIYHTREECLPDLPKERRNFQYNDIADPEIQSAYNDAIEEMTDFVNDAESKGKTNSLDFYRNILEFLGKMRHLTGLAKVDAAVVHAEEFLLSTERKLVLFVHHIDVGDLIENKLRATCTNAEYDWIPLRLLGGMNSQKLEQVKESFLTGPSRILIASTLAAGEGLNLQPVSDAVMVERQWNSVNEEQAERRFSRPGATANSINIDYLIAISTVDDYLTEIVERKRKYVTEAISGVKVDTTENAVLSELVNALTRAGKVKWRL